MDVKHIGSARVNKTLKQPKQNQNKTKSPNQNATQTKEKTWDNN